jgi:hypothetical protein
VGNFARASRDNLKGTALKPTLFVLGVLVSALILALTGFGLGWFLSGQQIANLKEGPSTPPVVPTAKPGTTLPKADVPGEDFSDLPRYPGSVRVEYQRRVTEGVLVLVDTEYVASAELTDVREFYRGVFQSEGWTVAGFDVSEGEWDFFATKAEKETVIEIEPIGGSVEIEIEVSEPHKEREVQKDSASPGRPEQTAPAPPRNTPSDGGYDFGDDYDDSFDEGIEKD